MENVSISSQASNEFYSLWQNRHFDSCVEKLQRLERGNPQDPKVLHNKAIAEFCQSGWKDSEDVLKTLTKVKVTLGRNYWDTAEAAATTGAYLATAEMSVVSLNLAIVHYHRNEVPEALALLEPLFACIGPLDDGTAFRVCLLLLDIYILAEDHQKAKSVLGFLEKTHGNLFSPDEREAGCEQLIDGDKEQMDGNSVAVGQIGDSSSSNTDESEEICADTRLLGLPSLSKMGLVPLQLGPKNGDARHDKERSAALDLKIHVHLYRVKLLLAMKNTKAAKRDFRCIQSAAPTNITVLFMKAQLNVLRGKLKKGAHILSKCVEGTPEPSSLRVAALCNMGVIYHQMEKHNSACLCFSNALKQLEELGASGTSAEIPLPNPGIIQEEKLQLLYTAGLQHLFLKRYSLALDCFREAAVLMFNKASLWLRMAECCLGMYHTGALDKESNSKHDECPGGPVVANILAEKGLPQVFVLPESNKNLLASKEDNSILTEANSYLQNACYLLKQQEEKLSAGNSAIADEQILGEIHTPSGQGASISKESHIMQSALCKMAYINLQLEQPERAYAAIEPLLQQPVLDKAVALLVNCYASEALCLMNRPSEAADQLGMFMARLEDYENTPGVGASEEGDNDNPGALDSLDGKEAFLSGPGARASLYVNLGSVYATQGNLLQAQQCARKAMAYHPHSIHAVLILVYVELAQGNKDAALALMKREKRVH